MFNPALAPSLATSSQTTGHYDVGGHYSQYCFQLAAMQVNG